MNDTSNTQSTDLKSDDETRESPKEFWPTCSNGSHGSRFASTTGDLEKDGIGLL